LTTDQEIKADEMTPTDHEPAAPKQASHAVVFWDYNAYWWTPDGKDRRGPFGGNDGLDDAITDAKRAGFKIYEVNRTRGDMPPLEGRRTLIVKGDDES
jgi:hypothetical protein